jgi:hypothetical protein
MANTKISRVMFIDKAAEVMSSDISKLKNLGIEVIEIVGQPASRIQFNYVAVSNNEDAKVSGTHTTDSLTVQVPKEKN